MPRLTVIMPAHNAERTIAGAMRSTLVDLPRDAALHVLDDASSDGTLAVVERLAARDKRIVVDSAGTNRGVAGTLNALLERVDGPFVARMDADDLVIPGRFRSALAALDADRADVVFGGVVHLGPGRRLRPAAQLPISHAAFPTFLLLQNLVTHSTMVARTSVIRAVHGYRRVPSEDYDLWLRLVVSGSRLRRLGWPGVAYRHHAAQLTATDAWQSAAADNPLSAAAHADLSEQVLGVRHEVFAVLRNPHPDEAERLALWEFLRDVTVMGAGLGRLEKFDLQRLSAKVAGNRLEGSTSYAV